MRIQRRGSMLIEVCSALAAGSMVMLLGVVLIERTMRWSRAMQREANLQRELRLLASAWREDFARADNVDARSPHLVVLNLPGKEIVYESLDHEVVRRSRHTVDAETEPSGSDSFVLGDGYRATFDASLLVIRALNPADEVTGTRLRVLGPTNGGKYRFLDRDDSGEASVEGQR